MHLRIYPPLTSTVGAVGQRYLNTATGDSYVLRSAGGNTYNWQKLSGDNLTGTRKFTLSVQYNADGGSGYNFIVSNYASSGMIRVVTRESQGSLSFFQEIAVTSNGILFIEFEGSVERTPTIYVTENLATSANILARIDTIRSGSGAFATQHMHYFVTTRFLSVYYVVSRDTASPAFDIPDISLNPSRV